MTSDSETSLPKGSEIVDAVIVGGGIAGLSSALFLARAGRSTIVYDAGRSRIFAVERIREFVGFDGWTPDQMLTKAREEVLVTAHKSAAGSSRKSNPGQMDCLMSLLRM